MNIFFSNITSKTFSDMCVSQSKKLLKYCLKKNCEETSLKRNSEAYSNHKQLFIYRQCNFIDHGAI